MAEVVTLTEAAFQQVRDEMEVAGDNLRLRVSGGGCSGMSYELFSEPSDQVQDIDTIIDHTDFKVVIDQKSLIYLKGMELDLVKGNEVVISFQGACGSCPSSSGATLAGIERAIRQNVFKEAVVIPTNAYGMKEVEDEMASRFGQQHPFGGKTYAEQVAERTKLSPLK